MRLQESAKVIQLENAMPREKWIKRITTAWREQLTSIFETGNLLEAAKAELKHGEWTAMFQNGELPFNKRTADMLICISQNDNVRNEKHVSHLPVHWGTLYQLTKLTAEQFDNGITSGAINPQMQRKDVNALRGIEPKEAKKKERSVPEIIDSHAAEISKVQRDDQVKIIRAVMEKLNIGIRDFADSHIKIGN